MKAYIVLCRGDRVHESDPPASYVLATRKSFATQRAAIEYARGIAPGRQALICAVLGGVEELAGPGVAGAAEAAPERDEAAS
jgi:hypothetical protein